MYDQLMSMNTCRRTTDKCEVEAGGGKEAVSEKNVENDGERTISAWDVGTFLQ